MASSVFSPLAIDTPGRGKRVLRAAWCGARDPGLLAVAVEGGTVLVHCQTGRSRSATLAAAHLSNHAEARTLD